MSEDCLSHYHINCLVQFLDTTLILKSFSLYSDGIGFCLNFPAQPYGEAKNSSYWFFCEAAFKYIVDNFSGVSTQVVSSLSG